MEEISGQDFENQIALTFDGYAKAHIARLAIMPVPTKVVGVRHNRPVRVTTGKAPFDVYGYLIANARMIGAELKASKRSPSLSIRSPAGTGQGLQFHQLDALAELAGAGGVARLVWSNGGEVGVLLEPDIIIAWKVYADALASEASGRKAMMNSKSIKWERFVPAAIGGKQGLALLGVDWLRPDLIK